MQRRVRRFDSIDKQALPKEKLGHPLPIYLRRSWLKDCRYEKLNKEDDALALQQRGFVRACAMSR